VEGPPVRGDLLIEGDRIAALGASLPARGAAVLDARGCAVLPGFVQTHVHLCQTLFRGLAEDLPLLEWLRRRVWPLEAAHDERTLEASALLGAAELLRGGTTTVMTMETVRGTDAVFHALERIGLRAAVGHCLMDRRDRNPPGLRVPARRALAELDRLRREWHGAAAGRLRLAVAPRFALSCSRGLLEGAAAFARRHGLLLHTHASEQRDEVALVRRETGLPNLEWLHRVGLTGPDVGVAHCVHVGRGERRLLARTGTRVLHCPSSNLKLGSGVAPVFEMLAEGVHVSLGADGAACNNRLSAFTEMRLASLLQKARHGPEAVPAAQALRLATLAGAEALGLEREVGSLRPGKRADVVVVDLSSLPLAPRGGDVTAALVHAAEASDVRDVLVDGRFVVRDRRLLTASEPAIRRAADRARDRLVARARLG
jgi:5-methylthioadenosine/S-adenosylhomocysteine deaminase